MTRKEPDLKIATQQRKIAEVFCVALNREAAAGKPERYQIVPKGEYPTLIRESGDKHRRIVQVIDDEAVRQMAANSGRALLDYEHASWEPGGSTEAAGWLDGWEATPEGLFASIEWSDSGEASVNGKRYRYLSPTFLVSEMEHMGGDRYRPTRVADAGLTNRPNMRDLKPLCNAQNLYYLSGEDGEPQTRNNTMDESVMALLGLAKDASKEAIDEAVKNTSALIEKGRRLDVVEQELSTLKNQLQAERVAAVLNRHTAVLNAENRKHYEAVCNHDLELGEKLLADLAAAKAKPGDVVITNRQKMQTPTGEDVPVKVQIDRAVAAKRASGMSTDAAFNAVRGERPDLFA